MAGTKGRTGRERAAGRRQVGEGDWLEVGTFGRWSLGRFGAVPAQLGAQTWRQPH